MLKSNIRQNSTLRKSDKCSRNTQRDRILELLISAKGAEVSLSSVLNLKISQYGTRILELRRLGFKIVSRTEMIDGQKHSWFRLECRPSQAKKIDPREPSEETFPEFGDLDKREYPG